MVLCVVLLKKYNVSLKNVDALATGISGGAAAIALGMIGFSVVKSFALVFPPAVLFALSGLLFGNLRQALLVNFVATALSLSLPYFMGRFTGKNMLETLSKRFKSVKKIDDFAAANDFAIVFIIKASGVMPSDLSSVIFGALGIPYKKYIIAANIGMLPLNIMWTLLGTYGDLSNPLSYLYVLPILIFAIVCSVGIKKYTNKKSAEEGA